MDPSNSCRSESLTWREHETLSILIVGFKFLILQIDTFIKNKWIAHFGEGFTAGQKKTKVIMFLFRSGHPFSSDSYELAYNKIRGELYFD